MVQVKAVRTGETCKRVKLDNWERFAKNPQPCFFIVLVFDSQDSIVDGFLVHVDASWIAKILHRLRLLTSDEKKKIHKKILNLTWREEQRLPTLDGNGLREGIVTQVGKDTFSYLRQKMEWIERSGLEDRPVRLSVTFNDIDERSLYDQLADLAIGRRDRIPVSRIIEEHVRFDIPICKFEKDNVEMSLSNRPSQGDGIVELKAIGSYESVRLLCKTYFAQAIFPFLPKEWHRVRFVAPFADFIFNPSTSSIMMNYHIPRQGRHRLDELGKASLALDVTAQGRQGVEIALEFNERRVRFVPGLVDGSTDPSFQDFIRIVSAAYAVARAFDCPRELEVDLCELLRQRSRLMILHALLMGRVDQLKFSSDESTDLTGKRVAVLAISSVPLGNRFLAVVMTYYGTAQWRAASETAKGEVTIPDGKIRILDRVSVFRDEIQLVSQDNLLRKWATELRKEGFDCVFTS